MRGYLDKSERGYNPGLWDKHPPTKQSKWHRSYAGKDEIARFWCRRIIGSGQRVLPPATLSQSSHLHRNRIDMDFRKSLSKPFKKLKHRLAEGSRKRDGRSGSENDRDGRETNVEGSEAGQTNSRLHSEVEDVVDSGLNQEGGSKDVKEKKVGQVGSSASTPPISPGVEPEGM